jgi:predicted hotdog family 3-hydroxylacyl-ACP dehydratase
MTEKQARNERSGKAESDHHIELADLTLEDLVPHRGTMLLLDSVLEVDRNHAMTQSTVKPSWPLLEEGGVAPLICVELAAQTAGVCNGWERIHSLGLDSNQTGWLVAVKKAEFHAGPLPLGTTITARAENTMVFDRFREVTSVLYRDDQLIAEIVLQLFQAETEL